MTAIELKQNQLNLLDELPNIFGDYNENIYSITKLLDQVGRDISNNSFEYQEETLCKAAVELTTLQEPSWSNIAGKIKMAARRKRIASMGGEYTFKNFLAYIKRKAAQAEYKNLLDIYSEDELYKAFHFDTDKPIIDPSRDYLYDYAGMVLLESRYLFPDELLQFAYLVNALLIASPEFTFKERIKFAQDVYWAISTKKLSLATPILANLRIPNGSLASCFITWMPDNLDGIFNTIHNVARISKNGGGASVYMSSIRATGSKVMGKMGASGGVIPWIKLLNNTATAVNQGKQNCLLAA